VQSRRDATTDASNSQFISENRTGAAGQYALYGTRLDNGSGSGFTPVAFGAVQTDAAGRKSDFVIAVSDTDNIDLSTDIRLRLDSSGNLGLGVTPSAWGSIKALQVTNASFGGLGGGNYSAANAYYDGSFWKYITSNYATLYQQSGNAGDGVHKWSIAPSGTAGDAISFTQAMTLDASGNLGVGATSPAAKFQTQQTSAGSRVTGALLQNVGDTANTAVSLDFAPHENTTTPEVLARINAIRTATSNAPTDLVFSTFNATLQERARITSGGDFGIGTSSPSSKLDLRGTSDTAGATIQVVGNTVSSLLLGQNADGGVVRGQGGNNALTFWTGGSGDTGAGQSGTERARITSGGELLVGLTSATGVALLQVSGPIRTTGYTVATLPAGTVGMRTYVTDALAPAFGVAVAGSGAVTIPVFYDGANWIVA
jgi:hypothetical protein